MTTRKLGRVQAAVLDCLRSHKGWHPRCGWLWESLGKTEKIMNQLVARGVAYVDDAGVYRAKEDA